MPLQNYAYILLKGTELILEGKEMQNKEIIFILEITTLLGYWNRHAADLQDFELHFFKEDMISFLSDSSSILSNFYQGWPIQGSALVTRSLTLSQLC